MKKVFGVNNIMLIVGLLLTGLLCVAYAGKAPGNDIVLKGAYDKEVAPLVLQALDYTENPVDIPNPDRGFYRPEGYVIPVDSGIPGFPDLATNISGTTVFVNARIVYMEFINVPKCTRCLTIWHFSISILIQLIISIFLTIPDFYTKILIMLSGYPDKNV